jgi:hypothetical protein
LVGACFHAARSQRLEGGAVPQAPWRTCQGGRIWGTPKAA